MMPVAHGNFSGKQLVVFGCGYVGGEVARQGLARGMKVTALTRNAATAAELRTAGANVVVADLASAAWHREIAGAEYVLNAVSSGGAGIEGYRHSYFNGMRSLLEWAEGWGGVGTLVYTSSTSVYPQSGGARVDENVSNDGVSERGAVLLAAEKLLRVRDAATAGAAAGTGVGHGGEIVDAKTPVCRRRFILRLAGIYGPGRHQLLEQVRAGEVTGRGEHRLNLIHRDDVCSAIWSAFEAPAEFVEEVFNVADDAAAPKAEIAAWLARRVAVPAPRFTGLPAGGRRAVTPDRVIVNAKLKRLLGWRPRYPSFRDGYENILSRAVE